MALLNRIWLYQKGTETKDFERVNVLIVGNASTSRSVGILNFHMRAVAWDSSRLMPSLEFSDLRSDAGFSPKRLAADSSIRRFSINWRATFF